MLTSRLQAMETSLNPNEASSKNELLEELDRLWKASMACSTRRSEYFSSSRTTLSWEAASTEARRSSTKRREARSSRATCARKGCDHGIPNFKHPKRPRGANWLYQEGARLDDDWSRGRERSAQKMPERRDGREVLNKSSFTKSRAAMAARLPAMGSVPKRATSRSEPLRSHDREARRSRPL